MEALKTFAEYSSMVLEAMGIIFLLSFAFAGSVRVMYKYIKNINRPNLCKEYRITIFRGILLALELLVAADIINTVAINLTFESVGVLTIIVLIRTFLSFTLEMEMTGLWPWQKKVQE